MRGRALRSTEMQLLAEFHVLASIPPLNRARVRTISWQKPAPIGDSEILGLSSPVSGRKTAKEITIAGDIEQKR